MALVRDQAGEAQTGALTRAHVIEELQEYARLYGPDFTAAAFNPATARWQDRPEYIERYLQGRPDGRRWHSLNAIKKVFGSPAHPHGSFNEARIAAGLAVNSTGPRRREAGRHQPNRELRIERVYVQTEGEATARLRKQLAAAERRAARAESRLAEVKRRLGELPAERIEELRRRLADETTRRRQAQRELMNAERRERRARAREAVERQKSKQCRPVAPPPREVVREVPREVVREVPREVVREVPREVVREVPREVVREVRVRDERAVRALARATAQVQDLGDEVVRLRGQRDDSVAALAAVRAGALAEAIATDRVREADRRVAEIEGKMAELAALVTGERRQLTAAELAQLRRRGPAGRAMFQAAVLRVARAKPGDLHDALTDVLRAGLAWRDRL